MAKETLEMVSNPPPPPDGAQVSQEEDEIKETEASLNADVATILVADLEEKMLPVQEVNNTRAESSMEPHYIILDVNQEMHQYKRLKRDLQIKKYLHFCCSTCVADGSRNPLCTVLEDQNDGCLCQHMKCIKGKQGMQGNDHLLYTERLHATPRGTEFVMYDEFSFPGEAMCCRVCYTRLGYRYLPRAPETGQFVRNSAGQMVIRHGGPYKPYFIIERSQLTIVKLTFNIEATANEAAEEEAANEAAAAAANEAAVVVANEATVAAANEANGEAG